MDTKTFSRVEIKNADKGEVTAVFATLNTVDSDGDVTLPGAFTDGAQVRISAYGHASWGGALPVGKGTIRVDGDEAILDGQFFLDTAAGRDTFTVVKELGELQEWSYGYDPAEFSYGEHEGQRVRFLQRQKVYEVSPVLLGAGVGTRTMAAKSACVCGRKAAVRSHSTDTSTGDWDGPGVVASIPDDASEADLRSVFAWLDPDGDAENKSSYKLPHHDGVGGAANLRACVAAVAALNGARGGVGIPDDDRDAVHSHLAKHLRDGDREVPELREHSHGGALKFPEEAASVLAGVSGLLDRASEVVALRAAKGKGLAPSSADLLQWVRDDLGRFKTLLDPERDPGPVEPDTEPEPEPGDGDDGADGEEPALGPDDMRTLMAGLARVHDLQGEPR